MVQTQENDLERESRIFPPDHLAAFYHAVADPRYLTPDEQRAWRISQIPEDLAEIGPRVPPHAFRNGGWNHGYEPRMEISPWLDPVSDGLFPNFCLLPEELRIKIWTQAIRDERKVFEMRHPGLVICSDDNGRREVKRQSLEKRALAWVCFESRLLFSQVSFGDGCQYLINFDADTIYFGPEAHWYHERLWRPDPQTRAEVDARKNGEGWERVQAWNHWRIGKGNKERGEESLPSQHQNPCDEPYHPFLADPIFDIDRSQIKNVAFDLEFWEETEGRRSDGQRSLLSQFSNARRVILAVGDIGESVDIMRFDYDDGMEVDWEGRVDPYSKLTCPPAVKYSGKLELDPRVDEEHLRRAVRDQLRRGARHMVNGRQNDPRLEVMCVTRGGWYRGHPRRVIRDEDREEDRLPMKRAPRLDYRNDNGFCRECSRETDLFHILRARLDDEKAMEDLTRDILSKRWACRRKKLPSRYGYHNVDKQPDDAQLMKDLEHTLQEDEKPGRKKTFARRCDHADDITYLPNPHEEEQELMHDRREDRDRRKETRLMNDWLSEENRKGCGKQIPCQSELDGLLDPGKNRFELEYLEDLRSLVKKSLSFQGLTTKEKLAAFHKRACEPESDDTTTDGESSEEEDSEDEFDDDDDEVASEGEASEEEDEEIIVVEESDAETAASKKTPEVAPKAAPKRGRPPKAEKDATAIAKQPKANIDKKAPKAEKTTDQQKGYKLKPLKDPPKDDERTVRIVDSKIKYNWLSYSVELQSPDGTPRICQWIRRTDDFCKTLRFITLQTAYHSQNPDKPKKSDEGAVARARWGGRTGRVVGQNPIAGAASQPSKLSSLPTSSAQQADNEDGEENGDHMDIDGHYELDDQDGTAVAGPSQSSKPSSVLASSAQQADHDDDMDIDAPYELDDEPQAPQLAEPTQLSNTSSSPTSSAQRPATSDDAYVDGNYELESIPGSPLSSAPPSLAPQKDDRAMAGAEAPSVSSVQRDGEGFNRTAWPAAHALMCPSAQVPNDQPQAVSDGAAGDPMDVDGTAPVGAANR